MLSNLFSTNRYRVILLIVLFLTISASSRANDMTIEAVIEAQISAYNNHDIDTFIQYFHKNIAVYDYPNKLVLTGIDSLKIDFINTFEVYKPKAEVVKRMILNSTVVDHELMYITVGDKQKVVQGIVIYEVEDNLIIKMTVIK